MTVISMFVLVSDTTVETIATNKTGNQFLSLFFAERHFVPSRQERD